MTLREQYRLYFVEQLEYEILKTRHPYDIDILEEILELIVDTVCTNRKMIRIASDLIEQVHHLFRGCIVPISRKILFRYN